MKTYWVCSGDTVSKKRLHYSYSPLVSSKYISVGHFLEKPPSSYSRAIFFCEDDDTAYQSLSLRIAWGFGLLGSLGNIGAIGRCDDDVILKLFLLITRRQKEILFSKQKNLQNLSPSPSARRLCVTKYDRSLVQGLRSAAFHGCWSTMSM